MLPSDDDLKSRQRRTAWWLGVVRRVRGRNQDDVAKYLGLKAGSSVGDFERGVTAPSLKQLAMLAALYEVPLSTFTEPEKTDEERVLDLAQRATHREAADWDAEQAEAPRAATGRAGARRRVS